MAESEAGSWFAKGFGLVTGMGSALIAMWALAVVVFVGIPLVFCFGTSIIGMFVGVAGQIGSGVQVSRGIAFLSAECQLLGKPSECWQEENRACVEKGLPPQCWVPVDHLPPELQP